jgi:hypothetical protein
MARWSLECALNRDITDHRETGSSGSLYHEKRMTEINWANGYRHEKE